MKNKKTICEESGTHISFKGVNKCLDCGSKLDSPKPMKRIKKECKHDEHHATTKGGGLH